MKYSLLKVGRRIAMLLDWQPEVIAQLQGHVAPRDPALLPEHACFIGGLQE
jgi:hypothetical protein